MNTSKPQKRLDKRAKYVMDYCNENTKNGKLLKTCIIELSERLFVTPRTIENDLYKRAPKLKY